MFVASSARIGGEGTSPPALELSEESRRVVDAWTKLANSEHAERMDINLGLAAVDRYLDAHWLAEAGSTLTELLRFTKRRYANVADLSAAPATLRELGKLEAACAAFAEDKAIRARLENIQLGERSGAPSAAGRPGWQD